MMQKKICNRMIKRVFKKVFRLFFLFLYYGLCQYLPSTNNRFFKIVRLVRTFCASYCLDHAGTRINIERKANFGTGKGIEIASHSSLGINCYIRGPLEIDEYVMMGPEVIILTSSHNYDLLETPMSEQGMSVSKKVIIKRDVWIGTRVIILPGLTIGEGSIIGAGSIVTKNVPDYAIIAGNPARVIGTRK